MDRDELAARLARLDYELSARSWAIGRIDDVIVAVERRGAAVLSDSESGVVLAAESTVCQADRVFAELGAGTPGDAAEAADQMRQRVEDIDAATETRSAQLRGATRYGGTQVTSVRVGREPGPYYKGGEHSFFRDAVNARFEGDPLAAERLAQHARKAADESRAVGSAAFAGLVVPQFLVADYAPVARAGRPFAEFVGSVDLPPDGMTFNVPRGNTGTLVNSQTQENAAVANQDVAVEDIVVPVRTIAGQQDMSRQSIDRGTNTDREVMADLAEAYAAEQDRQVINGTGATGEHLGLLTTTDVATVTMTSTSGVNQLRKIAEAISSVHSNRFMPATVIVVHPRRWAYWSATTDSQGRPLVVPSAYGPNNAYGLGDLSQAMGVVGSLFGLPVLLDANMPTTLSFDVTVGATTDPIIVTRHTDLRLYEDSPVPRRVRFEETLSGQLTVKVVAWDYSAWTAGRYPAGTAVVSGSGLGVPTFG